MVPRLRQSSCSFFLISCYIRLGHDHDGARFHVFYRRTAARWPRVVAGRQIRKRDLRGFLLIGFPGRQTEDESCGRVVVKIDRLAIVGFDDTCLDDALTA